MSNYGQAQLISGLDDSGTPRVVKVASDGSLPLSVEGGVTVDNGTPITGESLPSGDGPIGWLSWIKKFLVDIFGLLGDRLPSSLGAKTSDNSLSITPATNVSFPVTGTFWQGTQPVSLAALPSLATGGNVIGAVTQSGTWTNNVVGNIAAAATDSGNPVKIGGKFNSTRPTYTDGQRGDIQISSRGGLIADYEDYVTNANNINTVDSSSSTTTGANNQNIITGNPTNNSSASLLISGNTSFAVIITGTWVGTLQFERTLDGGTTWTSIGAFSAGTNYITQTTTANGAFHGNSSSSNGIRVRATAWTSGVASVRILAGQGTGTITIGNPIRLYDQSSNSQATIKAASTTPAFTDTALVVVSRNASGFSSFRTTSLTNTAQQIKASGGTINGINFINKNSTTVYVKFYDSLSAGVTVGTTSINSIIAVPPGSDSIPGNFYIEAQDIPVKVFTTAISCACVTGIADNNTAAPTTSIYAEVDYR
jgi:hypothetical protein